MDRKKDLIIRGGYNVSPREIEEVLAAYKYPRHVRIMDALPKGPDRQDRQAGHRHPGRPDGAVRMPGRADLRTAAHPADQVVTGNAVPVTEFLKLLGINLIGQNPQRLVSFLLVTVATQGVNHPLPAISHMHHRRAGLQLDVR